MINIYRCLNKIDGKYIEYKDSTLSFCGIITTDLVEFYYTNGLIFKSPQINFIDPSHYLIIRIDKIKILLYNNKVEIRTLADEILNQIYTDVTALDMTLSSTKSIIFDGTFLQQDTSDVISNQFNIVLYTNNIINMHNIVILPDTFIYTDEVNDVTNCNENILFIDQNLDIGYKNVNIQISSAQEYYSKYINIGNILITNIYITNNIDKINIPDFMLYHTYTPTDSTDVINAIYPNDNYIKSIYLLQSDLTDGTYQQNFINISAFIK